VSSGAVVVGAGIAGLTLADRLAERGHRVVVIEKQPEVGGLARSFRYGPWVFDIGPHRFHTYSPMVEDYVTRILGDELRVIDRRSSVYLFGKLHRWPLRTRSLLRLPPSMVLHCFVDLFRRTPFDGCSFESFIVSRYGRTLYEKFFRGYTQKFTHLSPEKLHHTWASHSIHRAIIDKRYQQGNLAQVLKVALLPKARPTRFIYPRGGVYQFAHRLVARLRDKGAEVLVGVDRIGVDRADGRVRVVRAGARELPCDVLVWTAPLPELLAHLGQDAPPLRYLGLVLFNIAAREVRDGGNQWTYYAAPNMAVSRVSFPRNFCPDTVPAGLASLCAEITVQEQPPAERIAALQPQVLEELEGVGLLRRSDVLDVHAEYVPSAYPVYDLGYQRRVESALGSLSGWTNVVCTGRTALFWYNNMDDSIEKALADADRVCEMLEGMARQTPPH
jgi:protoporphyrinogen oxidase